MKTLLVVEDDFDIQEYYKILLAGLDLRLLQAWTGQEALAFFDAGEPIDLVLLDIVLPEMGGEEFFRRLRVERGSEVPVVVCSVDERLIEPLRRYGEIQGTFLKGEGGGELVALVKSRLAL